MENKTEIQQAEAAKAAQLAQGVYADADPTELPENA